MEGSQILSSGACRLGGGGGAGTGEVANFKTLLLQIQKQSCHIVNVDTVIIIIIKAHFHYIQKQGADFIQTW